MSQLGFNPFAGPRASPLSGASLVAGQGANTSVNSVLQSTGRSADRFASGLQQMFNREQQTDEREAGQLFKTGEREAGQTFVTGEREAGQEFMGDMASAAASVAKEAADVRSDFEMAEREAGEGFKRGEADKFRTHQTDLSEQESGQRILPDAVVENAVDIDVGRCARDIVGRPRPALLGVDGGGEGGGVDRCRQQPGCQQQTADTALAAGGQAWPRRGKYESRVGFHTGREYGHDSPRRKRHVLGRRRRVRKT